MAPHRLSIAGEHERNFAPTETHQFKVDVAIPPEAAAATFQFRLDACSTQNPDDDYTEGPVVAVEVARSAPQPPPAPEKKFPWWVVIVLAGIVMVGGVSIFFILSGQKPPEGFCLVGDPQSVELAVEKFNLFGIGPIARGEPAQRGQRVLFTVSAVDPISQEARDAFEASKDKPRGKASILLVKCSFVFNRNVLWEQTAPVRELLQRSGAASASEAANMPIIQDNDGDIKTKLEAL